jgi:hypothetical protein
MTDIIKKIDMYLLSEQSYKEFFNVKLKKFGVSGISELDDAKKKEFFNEVDKEWKGKKEAD